MEETLNCNVCEKPGSYAQASEVNTIRCNVRRFGHERFTMWRCTHCNSLHCKEAVDLDAYYADYPMTRQTRDFATERAFANRLRVMRRFGLRDDSLVLDYGCGKGLFVSFLREKGFNATGYDPYVPEFANREILDARFDFVTSQDVIEHVAEPRELAVEYRRLLKTGGMLFIGTPNADEIKLDERFSMELHPPYHRHILSERALRDICLGAGLKPVRTYHRFYFDTPFPMVNTQFIKRYIRKTGGYLDAGFEKPRVAMVLTSPELLFYGFFGYLFRSRGNMLGVFKNVEDSLSGAVA